MAVLYRFMAAGSVKVGLGTPGGVCVAGAPGVGDAVDAGDGDGAAGVGAAGVAGVVAAGSVGVAGVGAPVNLFIYPGIFACSCLA
jgi:hypothetical protein